MTRQDVIGSALVTLALVKHVIISEIIKGPLDSCLERYIGLGLGVGLGIVGQRGVW